jgi:hypothetical protein
MEIIVRATVSCLLVSLLLPFAFFFPPGALGAYDFAPFLIWSLVYAVGLGLLAGLSSGLLARFPLGISLAAAILLGVIAALLWTWALTLVLGPWIAFPVWIIGGVVGMVVAQPAPAERLHLPPALVSTLPMILLMSAVLLALLLWSLIRFVVR